MDLVITNDELYFLCFGNDLTFRWIKFHENICSPIFKVGLGQFVNYYREKM